MKIIEKAFRTLLIIFTVQVSSVSHDWCKNWLVLIVPLFNPDSDEVVPLL